MDTESKSPIFFDVDSEWALPAFESLHISFSNRQQQPSDLLDKFTHFSFLKSLNLKFKTQQYLTIPKTPITCLKILDLSESAFTSIPEGFFDKIVGLVDLNLSYTRNLQSLPKLNNSMPNLKNINLACSPIQSLSEDFFDNLIGLEELDLSGTDNLQSLPKLNQNRFNILQTSDKLIRLETLETNKMLDHHFFKKIIEIISVGTRIIHHTCAQQLTVM